VSVIFRGAARRATIKQSTLVFVYLRRLTRSQSRRGSAHYRSRCRPRASVERWTALCLGTSVSHLPRWSVTFCSCGPVDLEFAARQSSWPRAESQHFQASTEDIHFTRYWRQNVL